MRNSTPAKIIGAWLFLIVSLSFPPLLLVSVPLFFGMLIGLLKHANDARHSREFYLDERSLLEGAKLWGRR